MLNMKKKCGISKCNKNVIKMSGKKFFSYKLQDKKKSANGDFFFFFFFFFFLIEKEAATRNFESQVLI